MNLDVQANKFINCGMTDSKEAQADNGYYRGVLSVLLCADYDTTKKTTINFAYNTVSESSCGVRAQSKNGATVLTAETFECKVNYNIFEDIALSNEIVTSRGNSEGSLIDAQYNFYNVEVTLEANFRGVASIDNAYASANAVPKKTLEDLTW